MPRLLPTLCGFFAADSVLKGNADRKLPFRPQGTPPLAVIVQSVHDRGRDMAPKESSSLSESEKTPSDERCIGMEETEGIGGIQQASVRTSFSAEAGNVLERNSQDRVQVTLAK